MIDLHTHIIPGIDDGSRTLEDSIEILKEANEAGFTDIFLTSHYLEGEYTASKEEKNKLLKDLQDELKEKNININLYCGAEVYVTPDIIDYIEKIDTLNNSKYILIELPMSNKISYLDDVIFELQSRNLVPIIAHPERYAYVQKDYKILIPLIEKGVLFQANIGSIVGKYGASAKKTFKKLLKKNMINFLATDIHKHNTIYTQFDVMMRKLRKVVSEDKINDLMVNNPKKVINNENI